MYLNLSSRDSLKFHPQNNSYDFIIELPNQIVGRYKCALFDFFCDSAFTGDLYVYTDICEPEYVSDSVLPLLRIVSEAGELTTPHFKVCSRQQFKRINIYIRDRDFNTPSFDIGVVRMTIALEEMSE